MDAEGEILVGLLAEQDAIWFPVRDWDSPLNVNVTALRDAFFTAGLPWNAGGRTVADRKRSERTLKDLEEKNILKVFKPRNRSLCARLTDAGEWKARELVGVSGPTAMRLAVAELARLTKTRPRLLTDIWISEERLSRHKWGSTDTAPFLLTENMFLPAMARFYAIANSSVNGHVYYSMTEPGWEYLRELRSKPIDPPEPAEPEPDREASDAYHDRLKSRLANLTAAESIRPRDIGDVPLPEALEGLTMAELGMTPARINRRGEVVRPPAASTSAE